MRSRGLIRWQLTVLEDDQEDPQLLEIDAPQNPVVLALSVDQEDLHDINTLLSA